MQDGKKQEHINYNFRNYLEKTKNLKSIEPENSDL